MTSSALRVVWPYLFLLLVLLSIRKKPWKAGTLHSPEIFNTGMYIAFHLQMSILVIV